MKTQLIKIGNSKGIRIPKTLLEQCQLTKDVELDVQDNKLIISPITCRRNKWEEAFKEMSLNRDDQLMDECLATQTQFDTDEWEM